MNKFFNNFSNFLLNLLFPRHIKCMLCDEELCEHYAYDICDKCNDEIIRNNQKICIKCGQRIEINGSKCYNCRNTKLYFDKARAPFIYDGKIIDMIHRLKDGEGLYLIKPMAQAMCDEIIKHNLEFDVVTYVPMHKVKERIRGYNQSQLLAKAIAKQLSSKLFDGVRKTIMTKSQASLDYNNRQTNLKDCFSIVDGDKIKGKRVLLVDDIFTTGATCNELSKVLTMGGAKCVNIITFAHTSLQKDERFLHEGKQIKK